ncbi:D-alanyl-lipoteichoic acid biosynthesis protein DltB [Rossellomorea marisflavi]|uniref:D-alanyl-lipoteichoic acid biosynthesis protein DltB n=1 Tax=Rossellomorea marisflavi TaxID=189381 RepID=UPI00064EE5F1|nr:D-alanyl-lipoteichoic acid biosynthesis protein DltB [Rossellomorea marisflavi]KMK95127.1 alanine transporter [Rossellomorea marisflavi]
MTVYGSFLFFIIIGILLLPTIILGLMGKSFRVYNLIISVVILSLIFSGEARGFATLIAFTVFQVLLIKGYMAYRSKRNAGVVFYLMVALSLLPLILSKVLPFLAFDNWATFLGISYLTFKAVQMVIEIRDGLIKEQPPVYRIAYFILFYPSLSSGPIDRYRRFEKDEGTVWDARDYQSLLYTGLHKIFIGFLYKFIIGYAVNTYFIMNLPYMTSNKILYNLLYMYGYSMYLFFDFAGYTAFAVGISYMMGIRTPENFNKPFLSRNIKDFWNRWHMTLSFWFRDYVFMRFMFLMKKKRWIKNKMLLSNLGYILLFTLMGVWHGLAIQYIVYGLYHAAVMVSYNFFEKWNKKHKKWPANRFTTVVSIVITFHVICFGFYLFSGQPFH